MNSIFNASILSLKTICLLSVEWCYWCAHVCYSPDSIGASPTFVRDNTMLYSPEHYIGHKYTVVIQKGASKFHTFVNTQLNHWWTTDVYRFKYTTVQVAQSAMPCNTGSSQLWHKFVQSRGKRSVVEEKTWEPEWGSGISLGLPEASQLNTP